MTTSTKSGITRAVCYIRVSTKNSTQESSLENQEAQLREFCKRKGWRVDEIITDHGISGRVLDRPGLKRIAALASSGNIEVVLAADHARFSRTVRFLEFCERHLVPYGVELWTLDAKQDVETAEGELINTMLFAALKYMARKTSDRLRASVPVRRARGLWLGRTPFGTLAGAVKGIPEKDPDKWPYLLEIFRRHRDGESQCAIADWLNQMGVASRLGGIWRQGTIWSILRSPFYRGVDSEGTLLKHDCLVPHELWPGSAQADSKCGRPSERFFLLRGLVCSPYWQVSSRRRYDKDAMPMLCRGNGKTPVYQRVDFSKNGQHFEVTDGEECPGVAVGTVRASWLERLVMDNLIRHANVTEGSPLLLRVRKAQKASVSAIEAQIEELARYLTKVRSDSVRTGKRLLQALEKELGKVLIDSLEAEHNACRTELERTDRRLALLTQELEEARRARPENCEIMQINLLEALQERGHMVEVRKLLLSLVERIELRLYREDGQSHKQKHGTVTILLKAPIWAPSHEAQWPDNIESLRPDAAPQCARSRPGRR